MHIRQLIKVSLFIIFAVSGFSGLIYESIWTHYLKLVLGHAAHSQTLVLTLFMGGMAIGAWAVSKKSRQISNPILVYAVIELIIGIFALLFHQVFIASQHFLYVDILPGIQSSNTAALIRWVWASLLILPQSILLGATFPLMSAGIVRLAPKQTGSILSILYFTNSLGAAIGVLVSGFILIDLVGLPGTILTAGILNIFLAIFVWAITKSKTITISTTGSVKASCNENDSYPYTRILLAAAFFTGLASFFYEIAWIRMLNQVLGSTTQSFELMLSAFITGIAFGGLWIRKYIDKIQNVLHFAGYVQIIMGLLAISTLLLYNTTFDFMSFMMQALQRNEEGYKLFMSSSHLIAFVIMVPTTFMAGMTLPLFTYSYMKAGYGERGIGRIYAANTLGSIIGIFLAVHIVMPYIGLKNLISLGSLVDILLGLTLIYLANQKKFSANFKIALGTSMSLFLIANIVAEFDRGKMASGIYRSGHFNVQNDEIIFHKDGKTSTVVVQEITEPESNLKRVTIRTNGKPDASVFFDDTAATPDEPTMQLMAAFPLAAHPDARSAAVIGFGSGISSNMLLKTDRLEVVDTIEIEQAMVEGARHFKHFSALVYSDPRSHIYIDDAKSFFSVNNKTYDLVLSEPSNPWVSGVASLFTEEFYKQLKPHLNEGGVLAQWLQIYEIDMGLVASVFKALNNQFKYYVAYQTVASDVVILASDDDKILSLDSWIFSQLPLSKELNRLNIKNTDDLYARRIGSKKTLEPLFKNSFEENLANSDFFPILSRRAPKARFMNRQAKEFTQLPYFLLPVMDLLDPLPENASRFNTTPSQFLEASLNIEATNTIYEHFIHQAALTSEKISPSTRLAIQEIQSYIQHCKIHDNIDQSFILIAESINLYLSIPKNQTFWNHLLNNKCSTGLMQQSINWLQLLKAVGSKDPQKIEHSVSTLLTPELTSQELSNSQASYIYTSGLTAFIAQQKIMEAREFAQNAPDIFDEKNPLPLNLRLLQGMIK